MEKEEYIVKRLITEVYKITASNKKEALQNAIDPFAVTVEGETVTLGKDYLESTSKEEGNNNQGAELTFEQDGNFLSFWIGNQGFDLSREYDNSASDYTERIEFTKKMLRMALDSYSSSHNVISDLEIKVVADERYHFDTSKDAFKDGVKYHLSKLQSKELPLPEPGKKEENIFEHLPENTPLYKDSGLWQLRTDDMVDVILDQSVNESDIDFFKRCSDYGLKELQKALDSPTHKQESDTKEEKK